MKNFSIKWKLSLALIFSGLGLVLTYVFVAKRVFESDKISYVYETQASKLSSIKREIEARFETAMLVSRSVILSYDPNVGNLSQAGKQIFQSEKAFAALELWDESNNKAVFRVENKHGLIPPSQENESLLAFQKLEIRPLADEKFLLLLRYPVAGQKNGLRLRAVIEMPDVFPSTESRQIFLLSFNGKIIAQSKNQSGLEKIFSQVAQDTSKDSVDRTSLVDGGSEKYLMTSVSLESANFKLIAMTPEADALGALSTLFNRSILFLFFSTFALIIISLFIAKQMTSQLFLLTKAAMQIGQGHFESIPQIKSQDEMGVLSSAFNKMSVEIVRLLSETRDKARMEAELKTAQLVQESLLPSQTNFLMNQIEINGLVVTSTECGGDWWHYFVKEKKIYVAIADATGHGTPAALITAAARSIFSRLENEDLSLPAMMKAWDNAISTCSKSKIFMTGILMQIDSETGFCSYIGAGHESPLIISPVLNQYEFSFLDLDIHNSLGEGFEKELNIQHYALPVDSSLILYTDGLFAVENAQGKKLSEKRFGKKIAQLAPNANSAQDVSDQILGEFNEHRNQAALPDDVSVVVIRRGRIHGEMLLG